MDDGLSSIIPVSLNFDVPISSNLSDDEDADAAEALKREQQIEEELKNASFGEYIDDDDESQSSDEESIQFSGQRSNSYQYNKAAADRKSKKSSTSFHQSGSYSSISHSQSHSLEEQSLNENSSHFSHRSSNSNDSSKIRHYFTNEKGPNYASTSPRQEVPPSTSYQQYNGNQSNELSSDPAEKNENPAPRAFNSQPELNQLLSQNGVEKHDGKSSNDYLTNHSAEYGAKSNQYGTSSAQFSDHPADLHEEYMKLQLLYETRGSELEQLKKEELQAKENFLREIKTLKLKLSLIEGEKNRLSSALQESQKLISEFRQENNTLKGKNSALELQLSAEKEAKISAQSKLESAEITIQSLEQQINSLSRSESAVRIQSQTESIMKDLKLRHQREVLQLKEEIDKLQEKLGAKIDECENLTSKVSQLQQKCEALQLEKSDIFNRLSTNLEASQRQYQKLLESGTISEVSVMRLQLKHSEDEKAKLEKQNASFKDKIRSLEDELRAAETLINFKNDSEESNVDSLPASRKKDSDQKLLSLKHDLKKALKNIQFLRKENSSLKEKLNELRQQLPLWEEKAKLFEIRFEESEKKVKEFEKKMNDVSHGESMSKLLHEKELNVLKKELMDMQKKYKDVVDRFKSSSSNEKKLLEANMSLENKIAEMLKSHASDKIKAVEECREKCLELHESAIKKLKDELSAKADKELQTLCKNYENKISELEKEIKLLNESLYDAKLQYVKVYEENQDLQKKIDSISRPKEYREIEKSIRGEYEKKLLEMKEKIQKLSKDNFESSVKNEVERIQEEWTKQKMIEISDFVETTKQNLDEEFQKCLEKESKKFQSDKEKLIQEYEEKLKDLKQQSEIDKNKSTENLREIFELKFKNEVQELRQNHQQELEFLRSKYEDRVIALEQEIKALQNDLSQKSSSQLNLQSLQRQYAAEKQAWEEEKVELKSKIDSIGAKLKTSAEKEKTLRDRLKKHQKYADTLKTQLQEKINQLIAKNAELENQNALQENQLSELEKKNRKNDRLLQESKVNHSSLKTTASQTEELIVSRVSYLKAQNLFIECLRKISEEVKIYLLSSRQRTAKQLEKALYHYHDQITAKILQDSSPLAPSLIIPHLSSNSASSASSRAHFTSPSTMQQDFNAKLSDFAASDPMASGDSLKRLRSSRSETTVPKTLLREKAASDSALRFEDISFDFLPIPDSAFMSTKIPDYLRPGGLFSLKESLVNYSSYPQKISPIAKV